ncbi:hypothetical protein ABIC28_000658 [Rhodococcus sp. PvR044]|nr:hypothetical protein C8K38_104332 [Rhodococcus sp. OK611]SNX89935.1 hypothetical protein SAMN05447004_103331 [Rhodococcus sp. OK270]
MCHGCRAAVAIGVGVAAPAAATADPLAPVTAFAAGAAVGDIAAPQGLTTQTLIAARNAGLPIYEAVAPDTFWVEPGSLASPIVVNLRETWQENVGFPLMRWDPTPLKFTNSPLVHLPDGGPSVGIALIT